ncbi:MAG: hypothetical protein HZA90_05930 [Verrucomicrobia bacterium]|nr:hypothetical protein [Verrucomicrobiota bacterium]
MPPPVQSRFWRRARLTFRWVRITGWLLVLALLCALLWLNRVGLPDFLKERLLAELRAHGMEVEFSRMRLRWYRGIVAENVRFEQADAASRLQVTAQELIFRLDTAALWRRQVQLRGVALLDGRASVPLTASNAPTREIVVERLQVQVDFQPHDRWQLSAFDGRVLGVNFHLSGTVANAPALFRRQPRDRAAARQRAEFWNRVFARLEQIQFAPPAEMKGTFATDGNAPETFSLRAELATEDFKSPWANGRNLALSLALQPPSNTLRQIEVDLAARSTHTPWGQAATLRLVARADTPLTHLRPQNLRLGLDAEGVNTPWGRAQELHLTSDALSPLAPSWAERSSLDLTARAVRSPWAAADELALRGSLRAAATNTALAHGTYELRGRRVRTRWLDATNAFLTASVVQAASNLWPASATAKLELLHAVAKSTNAPLGIVGMAKSVKFDGQLSLPPRAALIDTNLSWLARLEQVPVSAHAELAEAQAGRLDLQRLACDTRWRGPTLDVDSLTATLSGGQLSATARWHAATRELTSTLATSLDPWRLAPLFTTNAAPWSDQAHWDAPPQLDAAFRVVLPSWTNSAVNWRGEVLPTLALAARARLGAGTVKSVPISSARAEVTVTNLLWQARGVELVRPEGRATITLDFDSGSREFTTRLRSTIDLECLRPALDTEGARKAFGYFAFGQPPRIKAEASGRWGDWDRLGGRARVELTNATFRGQAIKSCNSDAAYTNRMLDVFNTRIEREEGAVSVDQVRVDFRRNTVNLTNVQSAIDPAAVAHAIGPHIVKTLSPYRFARPPTVHFEGTVGIYSKSGLDDARFEVSGGPFQWQNFKFDQVSARLHWLDETLSITSFGGAIHEGTAAGAGFFDFADSHAGTRFQFDLTATNVSAGPLLADLFPASTNHLAGSLGGRLVVTNATTADLRSWFGHGDVSLRDGLIWDEPVFALFSPALNKVVPGIGNSRARRASATFVLTNSVLFSRDLEVHATGMRMQFDGAVDFDGNVQGKMEAELFRNTPGLGWLVSKILWPVTKIFEYKITGTLGHPKAQPLYIPKIFMAPLHPLRTLKELFGEDKKPEPTNAPSAGPPAPKPQ